MSSSRNKTALYFAGRYLFARKSHNVINVISAISAIGMALGTTALILILSVYNGFNKIIKDNISDLDPDILVTPSHGKFFIPSDTDLNALAGDPAVRAICPVIEDNVYFTYGESSGIARARGVDTGYEEMTGMADHITEGTFSMYEGDIAKAAIGSTLAFNAGIRPHFLEPLKLYYPDRNGRISIANPVSSLKESKVWPGSVFSISSNTDSELIIVPIGTMSALIGDEDMLTGIEVRLKDGSDRAARRFMRNCRLEGDYTLSDRYMQHTSLFRMMRYEKFAISLILIFVVIIVAFNIFGSLSMLIIEKEGDIATLHAMGATDSLVNRIFTLEGWLVSLLGLAAGLVAGTGLALIQQKFGLIKMPGGFLIRSYPVIVQWSDILLTALTVSAIGLVISLIAARRHS